MIIKESLGINIYFDKKGFVILRQYSEAFGTSTICLTMDQLEKIEHWFFKNKDEIELAWNEGVEDDSEA